LSVVPEHVMQNKVTLLTWQKNLAGNTAQVLWYDSSPYTSFI